MYRNKSIASILILAFLVAIISLTAFAGIEHNESSSEEHPILAHILR